MFLEYVGAPELARLLTRSPEYWLHHMTHDEAVSAALQLQRDAGPMMTNLQILSQFITSLNRVSSKVMGLVFACSPGGPLHDSYGIVVAHG